jgi:ribosomal protein S18 acetylase RimI-like enzyme
MEHVLDNPGYNALISGNKHLAHGNDEVKFFAEDVSLFCGLRDKSTEQFQTLYDLVPHDGPVGFVNNQETPIPAIWNVVNVVKAFQMVYDISQTPAAVTADLVPLTDEHIPQMLALTKLTNPGPFTPRTIDFGHYYGIFDGDKLVAMAGQRMHIFEYAEISAVCTHPDYLGRGYAKQLLLAHIHRIKAASGIPILHVRTNNERAVKVYESIGFKPRTHMYFNIMMKNKQA